MMEAPTFANPGCAARPTVRYVCPECGEAALYADASIYWDVDSQNWEVSDCAVDDRTTLYCGDCGNETDPREAKKT